MTIHQKVLATANWNLNLVNENGSQWFHLCADGCEQIHTTDKATKSEPVMGMCSECFTNKLKELTGN